MECLCRLCTVHKWYWIRCYYIRADLLLCSLCVRVRISFLVSMVSVCVVVGHYAFAVYDLVNNLCARVVCQTTDYFWCRPLWRLKIESLEMSMACCRQVTSSQLVCCWRQCVRCFRNHSACSFSSCSGEKKKLIVGFKWKH